MQTFLTSIAASLSLMTVSAPQQQSIVITPTYTTARTYKVGDTDTYQFSITTEGQGSVSALLIEQVTKVYPSGDADILETVTKFEAKDQLAMPTPTPRTVRYNKYGLLVGDGPKDPVSMAIFSTIIPEAKDLAKSYVMSWERSLPSMGNSQVQETAKIVESDGTILGIGVAGKILNAFGGGTTNAADFAGNLVWDTKAKIYNRATFHVGATDPAGKKLSYNFSFERIVPTPVKKGN